MNHSAPKDPVAVVGPIRRDLGAWLVALAGPAPTPAGGALALATLAGVAALGAKVARLSRAPGEAYGRHVEAFLAAADQDADGYPSAARDGGARALQFLRNGVAAAERAVALLDDLSALHATAPPAIIADVIGARHLTRAAALVLLENLRTNAARWRRRTPGVEEIDCAAAAMAGRLARS